MEADNFIPANPLVTPAHIIPEWYFLFAYSVLRSLSSKLGGFLGLIFSILVLSSRLGFCHQLMKGLVFYGPVKFLFWVHVSSFILLTLGGTWPAEYPFSRVLFWVSTVFIFYHILLTHACKFWENLIF